MPRTLWLDPQGRRLAGALGAEQQNGRIDVSETVAMSASVAARYAAALFDLAREDKALGTLEADVNAIDAALADSADLRAVIASPVISRDEQAAAIGAIAARMGLSALVANTLALMAAKRRLFALPQLLADLRGRIAAEKGEVTAEVAVAAPLSADQRNALAATLKASVGKTINLRETVDETLIGGLVVKVGSKMIDTSIRSKLAALQNAMKEVG